MNNILEEIKILKDIIAKEKPDKKPDAEIIKYTVISRWDEELFIKFHDKLIAEGWSLIMIDGLSYLFTKGA